MKDGFGAERSARDWAAHFERWFYAGAVDCPPEHRGPGLEIVRDAQFCSEVAGESYYRAAFDTLMRGVPVTEGTRHTVVLAALVREPSNPRDEHAVAVHAVFGTRSGLLRKPRVRNMMIGHIPAARAPAVAASLAAHEADHRGEHIITAAWLRRRHDPDSGRTFDWAKLNDISELHRCRGTKKDGERCRSSAAERKLTCSVHDPDRKAARASKAKRTSKTKAPKATVTRHETRPVEDLREGDLWICAASRPDLSATPQMVTGTKTVTEKHLLCSDTARHASWCDDHEDCEDTDTSVIVSTVGIRGGEYAYYLDPGEHVIIGIAHETDPN